MEACVVVCRTHKPKARRGKILFINAVNEVTRERAQSFLTDHHIERIVRAYQSDKDDPGFSRLVPIEEIRAKDGNLSIPLFRAAEASTVQEESIEYRANGLPVALTAWLESSKRLRKTLAGLIN